MLSKILTSILIAIVGILGYMVIKNNNVPGYIGVTEGKLAPLPGTPNAVSSQSSDPERLVDPLPFTETTSAIAAVKKVLAHMGNNRVYSEKSDYLHIIFTTPTMRYHDDVELYFDTSSGVIHYRSQSRVGYSDRGLNRERYNTFSSLYSELK
jgi:uncharacterized protein (DUF1499 family)